MFCCFLNAFYFIYFVRLHCLFIWALSLFCLILPHPPAPDTPLCFAHSANPSFGLADSCVCVCVCRPLRPRGGAERAGALDRQGPLLLRSSPNLGPPSQSVYPTWASCNFNFIFKLKTVFVCFARL